jgi:AraC-like DNA-binding protein
MHIEVPDEKYFAANWRRQAVGPLQLITLEATPQRVVHLGEETSSHEPIFQLCYCKQSPIVTRVGANRFLVDAGEFVLVDNAQSYEMRMESTNISLDLIIPGSWLECWLPEPLQYVARAHSASTKWGAPFGVFLSTLAGDLHSASLPRTLLAEQVGALLALAVGCQPATGSKHKATLVRRLLQLIKERYDDPGLHPGEVARALGISKRYLHALLADSGTTFVGALSAIRLDRASELLSDRRFGQLQIGEISLQCGYLDPSYFARAFRRRFGVGPREWRARRW